MFEFKRCVSITFDDLLVRFMEEEEMITYNVTPTTTNTKHVYKLN